MIHIVCVNKHMKWLGCIPVPIGTMHPKDAFVARMDEVQQTVQGEEYIDKME